MRDSGSETRENILNAALAALDADGLRGLVQALLPWLDEGALSRVEALAVAWAARGGSGWTPPSPSEARVNEIEALLEEALETQEADPADVDDALQAGSHAFLARDYSLALRILLPLLPAISDGSIYLGQHELLDEVLEVDVDACASQCLVASYMAAAAGDRPQALLDTLGALEAVAWFSEPLRELEAARVEPLPDFDDFLATWQRYLEDRADQAELDDWDDREPSWLREVVGRRQGRSGLARLARRTGRPKDLRAWTEACVQSGDWAEAKVAFEAAAEQAAGQPWVASEFLDGAVWAASQLGAQDKDVLMERAWRTDPTLRRLQRWLGACTSRTALRDRAQAALALLPEEAHRQRSLLYLLTGQLAEAAQRLAEAPGLGWSRAEHPGHLVFPVFVMLLGGDGSLRQLPSMLDDLEVWVDDGEESPELPAIDALLKRAQVTAPKQKEERSALCASMRQAAEKRLHGVTSNKRRNHYPHAASLAVRYASAEESAEATAWLQVIMKTYRRYPALTRTFRAQGA